MTEAAAELGLSQSGVSQHIKQLEEMLKISLFERVKQKLVPTQYAHIIFDSTSKALSEIEKALVNVGRGDLRFQGKLRLGSPREFGRNLLAPHMEKLLKDYPLLRINLFFGDALEMGQMLLDGQLDIAFVDSHSMDPSLKTLEVFEEIVYLCAHETFELPSDIKRNKSFFESQQYMSYFEDASLLRKWFKQQHGFSKINLKIASTVMDVEVVYRLVKERVGLGILPDYFLRKIQERDGVKLKIIGGELASVKNPIKMAYLKSRGGEPLLNTVVSYFKEASFLKS